MSDQSITLRLEIPSEIAQQDVWNLEDRLGQINGITTDLHEPRDPFVAALLMIVTIAGGFNTIHDFAQNIYDFLHAVHKDVASEQSKNKVVITRNGERIELYNLTTEQIEKVIQP